MRDLSCKTSYRNILRQSSSEIFLVSSSISRGVRYRVPEVLDVEVFSWRSWCSRRRGRSSSSSGSSVELSTSPATSLTAAWLPGWTRHSRLARRWNAKAPTTTTLTPGSVTQQHTTTLRSGRQQRLQFSTGTAHQLASVENKLLWAVDAGFLCSSYPQVSSEWLTDLFIDLFTHSFTYLRTRLVISYLINWDVESCWCLPLPETVNCC